MIRYGVWRNTVVKLGERAWRECLNVSQKTEPKQFVLSFAQSSSAEENAGVKEKLKLCRRSYYCLEPPWPILDPPLPPSFLLPSTSSFQRKLPTLFLPLFVGSIHGFFPFSCISLELTARVTFFPLTSGLIK